jgi:hypothetical protein
MEKERGEGEASDGVTCLTSLTEYNAILKLDP